MSLTLPNCFNITQYRISIYFFFYSSYSFILPELVGALEYMYLVLMMLRDGGGGHQDEQARTALIDYIHLVF